jgi:hypothetical protein
MSDAPRRSYPANGYADLVKELHQAADEYDQGHGPLHAAAANAIDHLSTLLESRHPAQGSLHCDDNWTLHRQSDDQMVDHRFSIWSAEHPVVLANEIPGEEGVLAHIVSILNAQGKPDYGAWRPIETFLPEVAAEESTPSVLVWDRGEVSEAYYNGETDSWWLANTSEHDFDACKAIYPTHWRRKPDGPAIPSTASGGAA